MPRAPRESAPDQLTLLYAGALPGGTRFTLCVRSCSPASTGIEISTESLGEERIHRATAACNARPTAKLYFKRHYLPRGPAICKGARWWHLQPISQNRPGQRPSACARPGIWIATKEDIMRARLFPTFLVAQSKTTPTAAYLTRCSTQDTPTSIASA